MYNVLKYTKYFQVRINQAKRLNITPSLDEKIQLYNMTEEVLWADLDRYQTFKNPPNVRKSRVSCDLNLFKSI